MIEQDIKNCKNDLDELLDKEQLLREYQRLLGGMQEDISALADKIDVISNIWRSVSIPYPWYIWRYGLTDTVSQLKVDMQKLHEE